MFEFHDVAQNSDEWFAMRGSRLTSSNLGKVMAANSDYSVAAISKGCFAIIDND